MLKCGIMLLASIYIFWASPLHRFNLSPTAHILFSLNNTWGYIYFMREVGEIHHIILEVIFVIVLYIEMQRKLSSYCVQVRCKPSVMLLASDPLKSTTSSSHIIFLRSRDFKIHTPNYKNTCK